MNGVHWSSCPAGLSLMISQSCSSLRVTSSLLPRMSRVKSLASMMMQDIPVFSLISLQTPFGFFGRGLIKIILAIKDFFRFLLYRKKPSIFEDLGLVYYGPVDGHDIEDLIKAFDAAKDIKAPVLIHVLTQKGKGYAPAESNPSDYHGVGPFDLETGVSTAGKSSYTTVFAGAMTELAAHNNKLVAISAAMTLGTGLDNFQMKFPSRFFDCGIAEEHCVTMAGGLAVSGFIPVVAIYSSFLQRAYDEMITDCCYMNSHVVFAIDRSGFVGNDGHTHHGLLDISYLNSMTNMTVLSPRDYKDLTFDLNVGLDSIQVTYDANQRDYTADAVNAANETFKMDVTNAAPLTSDTVLTWQVATDAVGTTYSADVVGVPVTITKVTPVTVGTESYEYKIEDGSDVYYGKSTAAGTVFTKVEDPAASTLTFADPAVTKTLDNDATKNA